MRLSFQTFLATHKLRSNCIRYSDFVLARLLFEATRDAGFWNLHWSITDQLPNSDKIWLQWRSIKRTSVLTPTATAECDELSPLLCFPCRTHGSEKRWTFWPAANHTVAVWVLRPPEGPLLRVVVPTTQIFLEDTCTFDTRKFDPWKQKSIYEYTRRDVPDSFEIPKSLFDFFLQQTENYAGASDHTLQQLRYLREGFLNAWTPEAAARYALQLCSEQATATEDLAAFQHFAQDLRLEVPR